MHFKNLLKRRNFFASNLHLFSLISTILVLFLLYFCIHSTISFISDELVSLSTKSPPCPLGCPEVHAVVMIILCDMSLPERGCGQPWNFLSFIQLTSQGCHTQPGDPDLSSLILYLGFCLYLRQLADSWAAFSTSQSIILLILQL